MTTLLIVVAVVVVLLVGLAVWDVFQRQHAIRRNFPLVGRLRYALESLGPELRQYIVTDNDEERPFSRDQRRWVYATAKRENTYFGFGTDNDIENPPPGYVVVKHSAFPAPAPPAATDPWHPLPAGKVIGARHGRAGAFRPASIVNISAMSFGSLSGPAVEALNRGSALAGCLHNTGEGGVADHHRHGGELVAQMGTGYFGMRDEQGRFDLDRLVDLVQADPVRAIEVKLSQGAKPGLGGMLPAVKVTPTIAAARGIPVGQDAVSPSGHAEFGTVDEMLDFIERVADRTGVPVGIKSAVGDDGFWIDLARRMDETGTGPDFIAVDGGEGGTGAAPLAFSDHVALPFRRGFPRVYRAFAERDLHHELTFVGSGKLGLPDTALVALALGCDLVAVGREAMLAIGCIQAQHCHTGHCPTGVATQSGWLARGLDPTSKADRCAAYVAGLRKELLQLATACGEVHPSLVPLDRLEVLDGLDGSTPAPDHAGYEPGWGLPSADDAAALRHLVAG